MSMTAAHTPNTAMYATSTILLVTPDVKLRKKLSAHMSQSNTVEEAASGAEALDLLERRGARLVVMDRKLPDLHSDELVGIVEQQFPYTQVVLMDGTNGHLEIPEDLRDCPAFFGFTETPEDAEAEEESSLPALTVDDPDEELAEEEEAEEEEDEEPRERFQALPGMVGNSAPMRETARLVRAVAPHGAAVLVTGETGTGKELVAAAVHQLSPRRDKPFVTVNCAAIPEALVEAELFGYTRGAFTGAVQSRLGRIHAAQGGTIFFDEIGELPLASQAKLLRFLESGEVQRLGSCDVFRLDVRVVAATNVDLEKKVQSGEFREDLFYRLSVFPIELRPLREREDDVLLLARHFLHRLSGERRIVLSAASESKLTAHSWPGNVRELRNVIERAYILSTGAGRIEAKHLRLHKPCAVVAPEEEEEASGWN